MSGPGTTRARTLLEQKIPERRMTFEEFAEFAEKFAAKYGESGTLSARHVQRLAAGKGEGGRSLGRPRPATARLLQRIFGTPIDRLLAPPDAEIETDAEAELQQMLHASAHVDRSVLAVLHEQLSATRRLDRQLGAVVAHDEVLAKVSQVTRLLDCSTAPGTREGLAAHLSELCTLAGWQALDLGDRADAWRQYPLARTAAAECPNPAFSAHSAAGQSFTLIDLGHTKQAAELLEATRAKVERRTGRLIRAWLAAAHGEALAADHQRTASLRAFDAAESLLPDDRGSDEGPYVVLDSVHLSRWRGHALARVGEPSAVEVLTAALDQLDRTFTRAAVSLRVDLATAHTFTGERDAASAYAATAATQAAEIGSNRQLRRLASLR